jgi:error-prone DNA polymerase
MGFYSPSAIFQDVQRHGVEVRDVSITESDWDCTLEPAGEACRIESPFVEARRAIRLGFRLVKGLSDKTAERIVAARRERPFSSLHDLIVRTALHKDDLERLAEAGALEPLVPGRRNALWKARAPRVGGLFEKTAVVEPEVALPPLRAAEQLLLDYGRKGLSVSDHPMRHLRERMRARGVLTAEEVMKAKRGQRVSVAGLVTCRQQPGTASGVVFITLEDETGNSNLILWNAVYERLRLVARHSTLLLAHGSIERQAESPGERRGNRGETIGANADSAAVVHVIVSDLERLDVPEGRLGKLSRDFH